MRYAWAQMSRLFLNVVLALQVARHICIGKEIKGDIYIGREKEYVCWFPPSAGSLTNLSYFRRWNLTPLLVKLATYYTTRAMRLK